MIYACTLLYYTQYDYGDSEAADATVDGYGGVMRDSETFFNKQVWYSVIVTMYGTTMYDTTLITVVYEKIDKALLLTVACTAVMCNNSCKTA